MNTLSAPKPAVARIVALAAVAVALAVPLASADAESTLERIKKAGVMTVANSGVYPPFEFKQAGKLVGFDVDLTNLVAREMGVKPKITVIDFKGLIPALKSGKVDVLITAMTYRKSRAKQIAFSESYYNTAVAIAVRKGSGRIASKQDLAGKSLGAELGTTGEREARSIKGAKGVRTYDTLMLAMRDLEIGRTDAVVSNLPPLQYLIHRNFPKSKVAMTYHSGWVGINTRLGDKALLAEINRVLKKLRDNGELRKIHEKWFGGVIR